MNQAIKIQINSLEALERLIGGDSKLEIEVRNSVVQNFTRKHLKELVNNNLIKKLHSAIDIELTNRFFDHKSSTWSSSSYAIKPAIMTQLDSHIKENLNHNIREHIVDTINKCVDMTKLDNVIIDAVDKIVTTLTDQNINKRLDEMVNKKLKEKLGL